jgi:hypothetical protein
MDRDENASKTAAVYKFTIRKEPFASLKGSKI